MEAGEVFDLGRLTLETLLWITGPVMMIALSVGLLIALFQALTSIQEITLTFVPKIFVVFVALGFLMPFMSDKLLTMSDMIFQRIQAMGAG